jgi:TRAP-type C4-dicarboxylate transport system permease small subunit
MFLICADIAGRTLFDRPIQAVPEIVAFSLVGCVFLQLASAVQMNRLTYAQVFVDLITKRLPGAGRLMPLLGAGLGCIVLSLVAIGAAPDYWRALSTGEFVGVEGIYTLPISPIKFTVVLGAAVAAFEYLRQFVARRDSRASIIALALLVAFSAITIALSSAELADRTVGILSIVGVLAFIAMGVPIAIALLSVGFAGLALVKRDFGIATDTLSLAAQGTVAEYVFATVPLFVLMGLFVSVSDIGRDSFRAAQQIFGRVRGGLGVATVAANAVFAAITGLHRAFCCRTNCRLIRSRHAHSTELAVDHLWRHRRSFYRRVVYRSDSTGDHSGSGLCDWRAPDGVCLARICRQYRSRCAGRRCRFGS